MKEPSRDARRILKSKTKSKNNSLSAGNSRVLSSLTINGDVLDKVKKRLTRNISFGKKGRDQIVSTPNIHLNNMPANSETQKEARELKDPHFPQGYLLLDFNKQLPRSKTIWQWAPNLYWQENLKLKQRQLYYESNDIESDYRFQIYKSLKYPMSNTHEIPNIKVPPELKPLGDVEMKEKLRLL